MKMKIKFNDLEQSIVDLARGITVCYINNYINADLEFINESKSIVAELISNAVIHSGATFVELILAHDKKRLYITVEDNGVGIDDIEKAKEPLYTTKGDEERAGLGFTIIEVFSEEMIIQTKPGRGTLVKVKKRLPEEEEE